MSRGFKLSLVVLAMVAIAYFVPWGFWRPTANDIVRHVDPPQPEVRRSHLLAYTAQDDQSEHESALLLIDCAGGSWRLLIAHRRRDHRTGKRVAWSCFSRVADAPDWQGWQDFKTLPTASEVDAFLRDREWSLQPGYTYHFRRAELYTETWKRVLGYVPSYRFTPPV
jgi:hypothetical protein